MDHRSHRRIGLKQRRKFVKKQSTTPPKTGRRKLRRMPRKIAQRMPVQSYWLVENYLLERSCLRERRSSPVQSYWLELNCLPGQSCLRERNYSPEQSYWLELNCLPGRSCLRERNYSPERSKMPRFPHCSHCRIRLHWKYSRHHKSHRNLQYHFRILVRTPLQYSSTHYNNLPFHTAAARGRDYSIARHSFGFVYGIACNWARYWGSFLLLPTPLECTIRPHNSPQDSSSDHTLIVRVDTTVVPVTNVAHSTTRRHRQKPRV